ncbi:YqiJ family protein [Novosphingobium sp. BL-8A]|uniref:YqiJ family protein n=1 Tax=Novosphingobium sp. BL-8A TaxID=3127639 RepID=UPI0037573E36
MVELLTRAGSLPFSVALALMLMFALLQIVGAGDFLGGDADVHVHGGLHAHGGLDAGLLSVLGIGRVPFLMWLMLLLTVFGLAGISTQELLLALTGKTWSAWLVAPAVGFVSLPITGMVSRGLGRIIPQDETTAIDVSALVGREAEILVGTAMRGSPARGRVFDHYGQVHNVMLEPDIDGQRFVEGERVLLVRREGELFKAIARGDHYLPRLD